MVKQCETGVFSDCDLGMASMGGGRYRITEWVSY